MFCEKEYGFRKKRVTLPVVHFGALFFKGKMMMTEEKPLKRHFVKNQDRRKSSFCLNAGRKLTDSWMLT